MSTPTGPDLPMERKSAIRRFWERRRVRRDRIKRLNQQRNVDLDAGRPRASPGGG